MKITCDKVRGRETPDQKKIHREVGCRKAASCVAEDLREVSTRQSKSSSGMQWVQ